LGFFSLKIGTTTFSIPYLLVAIIIGVLLACILFFLTSEIEPPKFEFLFLIWGFVISIIWILLSANELVGMLQAIGLIADISDVILGATVLAWGNSLGDFVADTVMGKNGKSRLAYAACYGGPCFNMLFGLGFSLTIRCIIIYPDAYEVQSNLLILLTSLFLVSSILVTIITVVIFKHVPKLYCIFLALVYIGYSVVLIIYQINNGD